jgi:hypothetical protein
MDLETRTLKQGHGYMKIETLTWRHGIKILEKKSNGKQKPAGDFP